MVRHCGGASSYKAVFGVD